jgi:hypothetical protein
VSARAVLVLLGLSISLAGLPGWFGSASVAAPSAGDGSDWSAAGVTNSSSAVTLHWDNTGNPAASAVYRDGRQEIPHTGGQTYDAISGSVVGAYFDAFGPDNGLGGLQVTVSQTQDLVNQAVNLDISGVKGGAPYGIYSKVYLQAFQCWGGLKADGSPDPNASEPDPATCQMGAGDAASRSQFALANSRYINTDPLAQGGDWARYFNKGGDSDVPFTAITGEKSGSTNGEDNEFFNATTTNEVSKIKVSAKGTATRQFEVQTSTESSGLGCGVREGQVSTSSCWLVIVPRVDGVLDQNGPIAPSLWAQRLQVRLGFRDIVAGCPSGQDRTLTAGSELLAAAAASWTPGLCGTQKIALGYTQLGDPVARSQFESGASDAMLTTQPAGKPAVYAPVALSAPVVAYALSYQPNCPAREEGYTEQQARDCGYASVADLDADIARSGTLVRDLRLDARLVAKLLTQSYAFAIFDQEGFRRSGWMVRHRPASLATDPEFVRLNPSLAHISLTASSVTSMDHLVLEALRSDGASQVWKWIVQDPDARAFLNGCPDADGMVVNPFYSTRTYDGCTDQEATLAAQADADRKDTPTPDSYADQPVSYPPDGSPFPLPGWQEARSTGNPPFTVFDFLPRADSMPIAGRDVAIGYTPRNSNLCLTALDPSCQPAPGKWTDPKTRQAGDRLGVMAITTAATAARFQLPTALLCDSAGNHCVGADTSSLQKAADRFVKGATDGVLQPGATDYASGAYPLTMPVYAGISPSLPQKSRAAYAKALQYMTTTGQQPGFSPGNLPPGYAPLTAALRSQAKAAIGTLLKATPAAKPAKAPATAASAQSAPGPAAAPPAAAAPAVAATPAVAAAQTTQFVTLAAGTESFPRWPLPFGLGVALLAGLAGPVLRLRSAFRIGR